MALIILDSLHCRLPAGWAKYYLEQSYTWRFLGRCVTVSHTYRAVLLPPQTQIQQEELLSGLSDSDNTVKHGAIRMSGVRAPLGGRALWGQPLKYCHMEEWWQQTMLRCPKHIHTNNNHSLLASLLHFVPATKTHVVSEQETRQPLNQHQFCSAPFKIND